MKIAIDGRLWSQTGVGRYIRNLTINLSKIDKKNSYTIFTTKEDFQSVKEALNSWEVIIAGVKWHTLEEQYMFYNTLRKYSFDLVHFPYFSIPVLYKKPFVITIHDLIVDHYPTGKASTLSKPFYLFKFHSYKYVIRTAAKNAKKIIVPSNATKKEIVEHLNINEEKIEVTPEAADEGVTKDFNLKNIPDQYFLYVGNAYPHKNLEFLLKSFKETTNEIKNTKLILVGREDHFYESLKEKFSSDNIVFYGNATDQELSYLYKNAIGLVMPSFMEGFGLPVLEAMANKMLSYLLGYRIIERSYRKKCFIFFA
jgi:glycosyltransferase involved in cell wall biosynthesis